MNGVTTGHYLLQCSVGIVTHRSYVAIACGSNLRHKYANYGCSWACNQGELILLTTLRLQSVCSWLNCRANRSVNSLADRPAGFRRMTAIACRRINHGHGTKNCDYSASSGAKLPPQALKPSCPQPTSATFIILMWWGRNLASSLSPMAAVGCACGQLQALSSPPDLDWTRTHQHLELQPHPLCKRRIFLHNCSSCHSIHLQHKSLCAHGYIPTVYSETNKLDLACKRASAVTS